MLRKWLNQADLTIQIEALDPILIKSGYATLDGPDMVPVQMKRPGEDQPTYFFPGTSIKGVFRSQLERIARTLLPASVCVPYYDPAHRDQANIRVAEESESFGCGFLLKSKTEEDRPPRSEVYAKSCPVCRMFGSLEFAGRLGFSDAIPLPGHEPTKHTRTGAVDLSNRRRG